MGRFRLHADNFKHMNSLRCGVGLTIMATILAVTLSGCALFDALDTYHYIGIYEVNRKKQNPEFQDWTLEFDRFCRALEKSTGYKVKDLMGQGETKMSRVVVPAEVKTGLNRVVISQDGPDELSISIIKVPPGEDAETLELKRNIETAFRAVGICNWSFYIQRSHGQIFNN